MLLLEHAEGVVRVHNVLLIVLYTYVVYNMYNTQQYVNITEACDDCARDKYITFKC